MQRIIAVLLVLVAVAWRPSAAAGQTPPTPTPAPQAAAAPQPPPRTEPVPDMQEIARGLGVGCPYCHVASVPGQSTDFRSDDNPKKPIARQMIAMVKEINERVAAATGKAAGAVPRVTCVNCHRGVPVPQKLSDVLLRTMVTGGGEAAVAQYRELRNKFYARDTYDFSEDELLALCSRLAEARPALALPLLQMNLEFNPRSARTYIVLARAYQRLRENTLAIENLKKALEIEPENSAAKGYLYQLEPRR